MGENSTKLILVVDDEKPVRDYLGMALEDAGFRVNTAGDGYEALESIQQELPDLISLDLVMPKHSGVRFRQDLKKNKEWSKIPILIVTGHARDDLGKADFDELTVSGPGVYLEKPVKPVTYVAAVRKQLGMEPLESSADDTNGLRAELSEVLAGAPAGALAEALRILKEKQKKS
jgi:CheY-like chemotaxis protein